MSAFGSSTSYRRPEKETTQWEDIHETHKTEGYEYVKEIKAARRAERNEDWTHTHQDAPTKKEELAVQQDKAESDDGSDLDSDLDDDEFMKQYRAKRVAEIKRKKETERFGTIRQINRAEYVAEVAEASKASPVVLHLYQDYSKGCTLMHRALTELACKKKATKFLKIKATDCIENFPDSSLPCLLVYVGGTMKIKFEGLGMFGGKKVTADDLEWHLSQAGACETDMDENPRMEHMIKDALESAVREDLDDA